MDVTRIDATLDGMWESRAYLSIRRDTASDLLSANAPRVKLELLPFVVWYDLAPPTGGNKSNAHSQGSCSIKCVP